VRSGASAAIETIASAGRALRSTAGRWKAAAPSWKHVTTNAVDAFASSGNRILELAQAPFLNARAGISSLLQRKPHPLDGLEEAARYSALLRRFGGIAALSDEELRIVQTANFTDRRIHQAGSDLAAEGEQAPGPMFIVTGWACRIRILPGGRRQVIQFLLPGDGVALHGETARVSNTTVCALTTVETIDARPLLQAASTGRLPGLARAIDRSIQQDEEFLVNHVVRLGRMSDVERLGHLLLELRWRLAAAGLATERHFPLPLTNEVLADALGMHRRRVKFAMWRLKRRKLAKTYARRAQVVSPVELGALTTFSPPCPAARPKRSKPTDRYATPASANLPGLALAR